MEKIKTGPDGAKILPCDDDEVCEVVSCELCLSEVPASAVATMEVEDYVHHFCGLECLEKWHQQPERKKEEK